MLTVQNNENIGKQIQTMPKGEEFIYFTQVGEFKCVKISNEYVASENAEGNLIIFDVYDNCLSIGNSNPVNYNAVCRMAKGLKVNN